MIVRKCQTEDCDTLIRADRVLCKGHWHQVPAALIREVIEGGPVGWPETYSVASIIAGLSDELGQAIGISALGGGADNTPIVEAAFAPWVADADTIADQLPEPPP